MSMNGDKKDNGQTLVGLSILLCISTTVLSFLIALLAAFAGEFQAAGIGLLPASIASGVLIRSLTTK